MTTPVIVAAARTPVGDLMGSLCKLSAAQLGAEVIRALLQRSGLAADAVEEAILGQVLQAGAGQGPARQAALAAGLPLGTVAWSVNQLCASGLSAVALGAMRIETGQAQLVIAGGQESMSRAPHTAYLRAGRRLGEVALADSLLADGLTDAFSGLHMGSTAEEIARRWSISRAEQDEFALRSHQRAAAARAAGRFVEEIVPISVGNLIVDQDEHVRPETSLDSLAALKPAFEAGGTVTAGNASGINDAAAGVLLASAGEAERRGLQSLARIVGFGQVGVDPAIMGTGPIGAVRKALDRAGWQISDLDLVESNEAFAAQALCVERELGLDPARTNVNGGAIALGHPVGASGARVLVTLVHELRRRGGGRGLATLCVGGGMGVALCIQCD